MEKIIVVVLVVFLIFMTLMLLRNNSVAKERGRMIDWIYNQPDWKVKRELLEKPSYNEMMVKIWRPVKWFYKDYLK